MGEEARRTGIDVLGDVSSGAHICLFYQTKEELIDVLVPYFKAGLENGELCLWVTSGGLPLEEARASLASAVSDLDDYIEKGQMEIVDAKPLYTTSGRLDPDKAIEGWAKKRQECTRRGFSAFRLAGDTFWVDSEDWLRFAEYEATVDFHLSKQGILAICCYPLDNCGPLGVLDVVNTHGAALVRRRGRWELSESTCLRRREEALQDIELRYRILADNVEDGVWTTDMNLRITYMSPSARRLRGYDPEEAARQPLANMLTGDSLERAMKVFAEELAIEETRQGDLSRSWTLELEAYRKDGSTFWVEVKVSFLRDARGQPVGLLGVTRDITERKRAEEALQKSESMYRLLADNVQDGIWTTDMDLRITYMSPSARRLRGYGPDEGPGPLERMLTPASLEAAMRLFREQMAIVKEEGPGDSHRSWTLDLEACRKDGSTFWVEEIVTLMRDEEGRPAGLLGVTRDITERKGAEEALRQSEERFRTVYEKSPIAMALYHSNGELVDMNEACLGIFGLTDISGSKGYQLLGDPNLPSHITDRLRGGRSVRHEGLFDFDKFRELGWYDTRRTGVAYLYTLITPLDVRQGEPSGFMIQVQDMTQRRQAEEALRESEKRYRLLADNVEDVIWKASMDLDITYVSPSIKWLAGYSVEEVLGMRADEILAHASYEHGMKVLQEQLAEEASERKDLSRSWTVELEVNRKDGSTIWTECKITILRDPEGRPLELLGVLRDVTERRRARQELEQLYRQERQLRKELEDEIRKRAEFLRGLVHELKTPLTPMLASSSALIKTIEGGIALDLANSVCRGANRLNSRIDELMDLAKGEVGMIQLSPRLLDPLTVLQEIARDTVPMAIGNGQTLVLDLADGLPMVRADEERLRQIVINLLSNACKFTPRGGRITLRARQQGGRLQVEVEDTGPGVSEEAKAKLFDPYQRRQSGTTSPGGLGVGLAISKQLVEAHGGRIWVESEEGKGCRIAFSVPLPGAAGE